MSNIDKRAQKELYAKVEQQAHSLRGNTREYQVVTGLCPVNVIEMHAQKILALLDELEAKDKRIAEQQEEIKSALARVDIKCAQLCNQDEIIEGLKIEVRELKRAAADGKGEAS